MTSYQAHIMTSPEQGTHWSRSVVVVVKEVTIEESQHQRRLRRVRLFSSHKYTEQQQTKTPANRGSQQLLPKSKQDKTTLDFDACDLFGNRQRNIDTTK